MVLDLFAVCLLVLGLGLVLGYLLAMPRVKVLEKELALKKGSAKTTGQELPQHQNSYWKFEGPKLQAKVLELEMQLEQLRSQTLWKD